MSISRKRHIFRLSKKIFFFLLRGAVAKASLQQDGERGKSEAVTLKGVTLTKVTLPQSGLRDCLLHNICICP